MQFPPYLELHYFRKRRQENQTVEVQRQQGLGVRLSLRPLKQRELRHVPPQSGPDYLQQRGQDHPNLGSQQPHLTWVLQEGQ